jgi:hypothetical protein
MKYLGFYRKMILPIILLLFLAGCGPMDETYREFWDDGVIVYPAKADSVETYPGDNRIVLSWQLRGDPSIVRAKIYWNNRTDSLDTPVTLSGTLVEKIDVQLSNLSEASYAFDIYMFDGKGNRSVPVSTTGRVYGDVYRKSLLVRYITGAEYGAGKMTITWGNRVDATSVGTEIVYASTDGSQHSIFEVPDAVSTVISDFDYNAGNTFAVRSVYLPVPEAIDTFYSAPATIKVLGEPKELPKTGWTATASSSADDRRPEHVIDGNLNTTWINRVNQVPYPHTLTVDMGEVKHDIYGFTLDYTMRNEAPKSCEFWYGDDLASLVSAGTYDLPYTEGNHFVDLKEPLKNFRFFQFIFLAPAGSTTNCTLREVGVFTRP